MLSSILVSLALAAYLINKEPNLRRRKYGAEFTEIRDSVSTCLECLVAAIMKRRGERCVDFEKYLYTKIT